MVETRSGRRFAVLFFAAAFLLLLLGHWLRPVGNAAVTVAAPFQYAVNGMATGVGDLVSGVVDGPRLRDENLRLKKEKAIILSQNAQLQAQAHENQILKRMLNFDKGNNHASYLTARVIGTDPNNLAADVFINRGSRDGIKPSMTVIDQNGYFIGQISDITNNASRVLLMISPSSSVGAQDEVTRATGLVEGRFSERPLLRFVNTRQKLQPGDFIVTSGQYNLFPRNIIIGQVMSVTHRPVDPVQTAEIVPSADFSNLEFVQVVKGFVPSVPFKVKVH